MRARLVKPKFFKDEEVADLAPMTRLLFVGLWCLADRAGRLEDKPRTIRAEVLPHDACDCDAMLGDLAAAGFIVRYQAAGRRYIQIRTFEKHQTPHVREPASDIPAPDEHEASTVLAPDKHQSGPAVPDTVIDPVPETVTVSVTAAPIGADHLAPATVAVALPDVAEPVPVRANGRHPPPWPDLTWIGDAFEQTFWPVYPRPTHKAEARKAWLTLMRRQPTFEAALALAERILEVLSEQREHWTDAAFTPHPATYLNGERWTDELVIPTGRAAGRRAR